MKLPILASITVLILISVATNFMFGSNSADNTPLDITPAEAQVIIDQTEDKKEVERGVWLAAGLTPEQYHVLWNSGTERPYTSPLNNEKRKGTFVTAGCNIPVFSSEHKFESGTGWPSFWEVIDEGNIILKEDNKFGWRRTEILSKCGEHLGHVFPDGPKDKTGLRYCINGDALKFIPETE